MAGSERKRELRRRRHRTKKVTKLRRRAEAGGPAEREEVARKLRRLTPGADVIIAKINRE